MSLNEQAPETRLGAEVHHQASMVINTHAGWIQRTWQKYTQTHRILPKLFHALIYLDFTESRHTRCNSLLNSRYLRNLTLKFGLRGAADTVLPENGSVIYESKAQLWLQVKVLPATGSHGGVEHIWHIKRHTQGHIGLDQVKHL